MKVSKNIKRGAEITVADLPELVWLAKERQSVVVLFGKNYYCVRPAAFILQWKLSEILKHKIYNALKIDS